MKRARLASERDAHRLMDDDQWDDFWSAIDSRREDVDRPPAYITKPRMTVSREETVGLAAQVLAREDAAALARSRNTPKSHRCGTCTACRASDCGRCKNCRDKPRYALSCPAPFPAPCLMGVACARNAGCLWAHDGLRVGFKRGRACPTRASACPCLVSPLCLTPTTFFSPRQVRRPRH